MNAANNINSIGDCPRQETLKLVHEKLTDVQLAFTRKMVAEMNDFGNFYFEVCNEPYTHNFECVSHEWQDRVIETIVTAERDLPNKHLISLNIANKREKVKSVNPAVSILNFHYAYPPSTVAMNYELNRVIGDNETGFRRPDDLYYRTEGWDFLLAGGALFNNLDYSFSPNHPSGTLRDYKAPGGGSVELRQQLGILKSFMERLDFVDMVPDTSFITDTIPKLRYQALVKPGQTYAVCMHLPLPGTNKSVPEDMMNPLSGQLELTLLKGTYQVGWFDTKSGSTAKVERIEHNGGALRLTSPPFVIDIALRVDRM